MICNVLVSAKRNVAIEPYISSMAFLVSGVVDLPEAFAGAEQRFYATTNTTPQEWYNFKATGYVLEPDYLQQLIDFERKVTGNAGS